MIYFNQINLISYLHIFHFCGSKQMLGSILKKCCTVVMAAEIEATAIILSATGLAMLRVINIEIITPITFTF